MKVSKCKDKKGGVSKVPSQYSRKDFVNGEGEEGIYHHKYSSTQTLRLIVFGKTKETRVVLQYDPDLGTLEDMREKDTDYQCWEHLPNAQLIVEVKE